MTRQEFIEDIDSLSELMAFCHDNVIDICDNIYPADSCLNDDVMDYIGRMQNWLRIRDFLNDIPDDCYYYRINDYGEFEDAEEFFDDYKDDVLRCMDGLNAWDDDEDANDEDDGDADAEDDEWFFDGLRASDTDTEWNTTVVTW